MLELKQPFAGMGRRRGFLLPKDVHDVHAVLFLFFFADLARRERIREDDVHFVVVHHLVDAHTIGALEPKHVSECFSDCDLSVRKMT
jgi:hypothetical protein